MATRIFSLAEADQVLPLVRRITADIRGEYRTWKQAMADYELPYRHICSCRTS